MKAYTLEWWIDIMLQSMERSRWAIHQYKYMKRRGNDELAEEWHNQTVRYDILTSDVYDRIINKYGEQQ